MAQFEKMLRKLSRGELTAAAGELLDKLFTGEAESLMVGRKSFADEAGDSLAWEKSSGTKELFVEAYPQSAVKKDAGYGAETEKNTGGLSYGERFAGMDKPAAYEVRETDGSAEYTGSPSGKHRWEAGGVSDFFRRDSRRYDREFERY